MKKMKLFYGVLIGLIILSSCSSENEPSVNSTTIVGEWKLDNEVFVCSTGNQEIREFSDCSKMTRIIFSENKSYELNEYSDNTGNCLNTISNGSWNLNNGNLTLGNNSPTYFELNGNILRIGYYGNFESCDNGKELSHTYAEYIRIE